VFIFFLTKRYEALSSHSPEDSFVQEVQMVQEDLLANDLVIDGEYMSEETMKNDWNFTQQPSSIKYYMLQTHTS